MKCIKNANVYIEGKGIISTSLTFTDKIYKIGEAEGEEISIPNNAVVLPGFIDQHIHGAGGSDFMDGSVETLETISKTLAQEGTVAYLATTVSASKEKTKKALQSVKAYQTRGKCAGAEVIGVHLEGPFICHKYKGGMNELHIIKPDVELLKEFINECGGCVKIVTYAPEIDEGYALLRALVGANIVPSLGHTNATCEQIEGALHNGLKNVTHTYNAMSPLHHREIGAVGSALLFDELNCELIADKIHVSVPAMKFFLKCKPKEKVVLVTDSMRAKGIGEGLSEIGGQKVIVKDGEARLENGTLAGSVLKMNVAIRNLVNDLCVPFTDAVDFATKNPAKMLGVDKDYGTIELNKNASFAVVDEKFEVLLTIVNGEIVYRKED